MGITAAIIQARMTSTRLPGKVLLPVKDRPVLEHVVLRVGQAKQLDEVIVAVTVNSEDDILVQQLEKWGVKYYRGSEDDVLSRFLGAAEKFDVDTIVRITGDCPLIDPFVIDEFVSFYKTHSYDIVGNVSPVMAPRTYPRGMDAEVFCRTLLEEADRKAQSVRYREHVTLFFYEFDYNVYYYKYKTDYSKYRLTLDTKEDYILIKTIYDTLYKGVHDFYLKDLLKLLDSNPALAAINKNIEQKKL